VGLRHQTARILTIGFNHSTLVTIEEWITSTIPDNVTSQIVAAAPASVFQAAISSQDQWAHKTATNLTCINQGDRDLIALQLKSVAARVGMDFAARFVTKVFSFAILSGLVLASAMEAVLWVSRIPSRHVPAATVAGAYLVIAGVAGPVCWSQGRRFLTYISRSSSAKSHHFVTNYLPPLAAFAILYGTVNAGAFAAAASKPEPQLFYAKEFAAFIAVAALGFLVAYLATAYAYARTLQHSTADQALQGSTIAQALDWTWTLAATAITAWLPATRNSLGPADDARFESGLLRLLDCAAVIDRLGQRHSRANPQIVRSVIVKLELAAADIERFAISRVPRFDTATRAIARQDGAQLAAPIRNAKAAVARGIYASDYTAVATTVASFLLAWASADQNHLAAIDGNAGVLQTPLWRRVTTRAWNAVLLAAAGVVLPLLPIYKTDHAAGTQVRYALLTAAVLALVSGSVPVWDTIEKRL
jgi:hypothetical protein